MDTTGLPILSAPALASADLPPQEMLLDPILATKSLALLYGPRGLGKTFLAMGIARAAAAGESFLGWHAARPHDVLYVDGEMSANDMQRRLALFGPPPPRLSFLLADLNKGPLLDLAHGESQRRLMLGWGDPELVVLDNLASLAGVRSGDPDRWHEVQRFLLAQRQLDRAVLMIHHANKKGLQRGSSRREDVLDLVMAMRRPEGWTPSDSTTDGGTRFEIHFEKTRNLHGAAIQPLDVRLDETPDGLRWHHGAACDPILENAARLFGTGKSVREVAGLLGQSPTSTYRLLQRARRHGLVAAAS